MTSKAPAPARPAPTFRPPRAQPPGSKADPGAMSKIEGIADDASADELARPPKRQKLETPLDAASPSEKPAPTLSQSRINDAGDRSTGLGRGPWRFSDALLPGPQATTMSQDAVLSALPTRPWQHREPIKPKEEAKPTHRVRKNIPIPNTPDKVELPIDAPKFGKSTLAGFCPWAGNHAEDVLSEANVRQGYSDRPPNPPEKEMGSARTALHGAFKHRLGLDFLSVLFGLALERKCKHGVLSTTSNFRPPPRVTLTEAKRKAWLTDLANPEVPLRKLSRTIPQGIRGQSLLDQCLGNNIPISRALWFIRCVGANEIRTLKRKGPGGAVTGGSDSKWLREWTSFVGQFLESALQDPALPDWKKTMQYALRLSSQLYLENLLDRDLFLDWIVKSLTNADHDQAAVFLLLVQMYMPDIVRFRRRSKRLASVLVDKLHLFGKTSESVLGPLISKLKFIIRSFATSHPVCFLMPDKWSRCKEALRSCLDLSNAGQQKLFRHIQLCNQRTAASVLEQSSDAITPHQTIIKLLDSSQAPFNMNAIMMTCEDLCDNAENLLSIVLTWATSRYRASSHRVYLAVRLLRTWSRAGLDVDKALPNFIADLSPIAIDQASLHQVVAELSRSRTFSVSKHLQEMILRGSIRSGSFSASPITLRHSSSTGTDEIAPQICSDPTQVLTEISLHQLPDHIRSLRKIMLSRAGFQPDVEAEIISYCKVYLSQKLAMDRHPILEVDETGNFSTPSWKTLSWSIKCEISAWLRDLVKTHCSVADDPESSLKATAGLALEDFCLIRDVLENLGDLAILADVLNIATSVLRDDLLASVADTLDRHADAFSAIGAFVDLQEKLCIGYLALRSSKLMLTTFTTSLMSLNVRHPTKTISTRLLQQDLIRGDQGSAAAACSPFSDGVAESLQQAGSHFFDDFEAILQTETNMNQQTMAKLFAVLTERIEKQNHDGEDLGKLRALCQLLTRLTLCRRAQSTELIKAWVERRLCHGEWATTTALLVDLVGTGCVAFETLVECLTKVAGDNPQQSKLSALAGSLFTPQGGDPDAVHYRFETECMLYTEKSPMKALTLLTVVRQSGKADAAIGLILRSSIKSIALSEEALPESTHGLLAEYLRQSTSGVLQDGDAESRESLSSEDLLRHANDFSYALCRLRLRLQMQSAEESTREEVAEAFFAHATSATTAEPATQAWARLLPATGPEVARHVRRHAEEAFFTSLPAFLQARTNPMSFETSEDLLDVLKGYLDVVLATNGALAGQQPSSTTAQLIEKLSLLHRMLATSSTSTLVVSPIATTTPIPGLSLTPMAATPTPSVPSPDALTAAIQFLPLLLRMVCLQRPTASMALVPLSKPAQQEQIKLVVLLTTLALHSSLGTSELSCNIFDVVSTLIAVPTFTDEMHTYCAKLLKDKTRDPRVMFLFGSVSSCGSALAKDIGDGLQLHKDGVGRVGEWKQWVRNWEVIEPSGGGEGSSWVGLGMFGGRRL